VQTASVRIVTYIVIQFLPVLSIALLIIMYARAMFVPVYREGNGLALALAQHMSG